MSPQIERKKYLIFRSLAPEFSQPNLRGFMRVCPGVNSLNCNAGKRKDFAEHRKKICVEEIPSNCEGPLHSINRLLDKATIGILCTQIQYHFVSMFCFQSKCFLLGRSDTTLLLLHRS